ncbi:MAG TPA: alpha/beta hydrolase [Polyangiaceae bacterium]|nr:alpha/beta hydrolase [Polyangiaceae bacterium]
MTHAQIGGVRLFYELAGSGDPIVFVHGSQGDHRTWQAVVPHFARRFRVLTYDRRGHGQSEKPLGQPTGHADVEDLAALVAQLGLPPAHFVGASFGAGVVLRLAAKKPELFRSVVAHEPPLLGALEEDSMAAPDQLARAMRDTFATDPKVWVDEMRNPEAYRFDPDALLHFDRPVLLTRGDKTPRIVARVMMKLADTVRRGEWWTFAGAGLDPHVTHADEYAGLVEEFLDRASS